MPRVLTNIVYHHHNPCYRGENYRLNLLTFLSDCLLGQIGIGDGIHQECPESVFTTLELDPANCQQALEAIEEEAENIQAMADALLN